MRLRLSAWPPLLDTSNLKHGLLLPILRTHTTKAA